MFVILMNSKFLGMKDDLSVVDSTAICLMRHGGNVGALFSKQHWFASAVEEIRSLSENCE